MDVAIGLPSTVPGATGEQLVEWAKRAEDAGFSGLGTIDRIAYPNYEPLVALSAAAAVTERVRLITSIAIAPYRVNAALLAKQAASVQRISNGRLVLGLAAGGRENDYAASEVDFQSRYERLEEIVPKVKRFWAGSGDASGDPSSHAVGPDVSSDPPKLILGGYTEVTAKRVAKYADGWVAGGVPPDQFAQIRESVERAWEEAGREGTPYLGGLAYFALGDSGEEDAQRSLGDYYTWLGVETAGMIVGSAAKDDDTVKGYLQGFEQAGCQELILFPASSDPSQVDLLADAALSR
jgi:alkanesulfonate monooxygenase SsuD/methylene tetrahydromethanopterin reductase-like flavin-dependent oxidoreductase (luciferase family)